MTPRAVPTVNLSQRITAAPETYSRCSCFCAVGAQRSSPILLSLAKRRDNFEIILPIVLKRHFSQGHHAQLLQELPIYSSNFRDIITAGEVYVDKTERIRALYNQSGMGNHFLARPRRFGKSTLGTTLIELHSGNEELFNGLWIGQPGRWDWKIKSPIVYLKVLNDKCAIPRKSGGMSIQRLKLIAQKYNLEIGEVHTAQSALDILVTKLEKDFGKVVVLIDEYDKPILDALVRNDIKLARQNKGDTLKELFDPLKGLNGMGLIKAIFITGVTKFAENIAFLWA